MITEDQIEYAKQEVIDLITDKFKEDKGTNPIFILIVEDVERPVPGIMVFPLPPELFSSKERKAKVKDVVLPEIRKEIIDKQGLIALATCFVVQGDMYLSKPEDGLGDIEDLEEVKKKLKPTSILMFTFEGKYGKNVIVYEVQTSTVVTPEGDLIENIELELRTDIPMDTDSLTQVKGTFHDIFKIFWKPE